MWRNKGIFKFTFGNHHSNNCYRDELSMDTKTTGWKDTYIDSKYLPTKYLFKKKMETVICQGRKSDRYHLNQKDQN